MATITARQRQNGVKYTAQIRIKHGTRHLSESKTFSNRKTAEAWAKKREVELEQPGELEKALSCDVLIIELIDRYEQEFYGLKKWGRSTTAFFNQMRGFDICKKSAIKITSSDINKHVIDRRQLTKAATVNHDITWLHTIFKTAKTLWGIPVNLQAVEDAGDHLRKMGLIGRPDERTRRPTNDELEKLYAYFNNRNHSAPMIDIVNFAIHSARRLSEIFRIRWSDLDIESRTCVVRDLKHPRKKMGNNVTFKLTKAALDIVLKQPKVSEFIFPHNERTVSAFFTRACHFCGIEDLRFHDLRHEATSRLFESGYAVHEVSMFTLHKDWKTLKRYTQLKAGEVRDLD